MLMLARLFLEGTEADDTFFRIISSHEVFVPTPYISFCFLLGFLSGVCRGLQVVFNTKYTLQCGCRDPRIPEQLREQMLVREAKLRWFNERKSIKDRLKNQYEYVQKEHVDDEVKRSYYTDLVRWWAIQVNEEIPNIRMEFDFISRRPEHQKHLEELKKQHDKIPARKPFVITKEMARNKVFGPSYPSQPSMSLEQFRRVQIENQSFPEASLHGEDIVETFKGDVRRVDPADRLAKADAKDEEEDDEKEDRDDPEYRAKLQDMDAYKDENRAGSGNTYRRLKHGVEYINDDEPAFIKRFKKKAGMKTTEEELNAKRTRNLREGTDEYFEDRADEVPQIVILEASTNGLQVTESDVERYKVELKQKQDKEEALRQEEKECVDPDTGKLKFRKPTKTRQENALVFKTKEDLMQKVEKSSDKEKSIHVTKTKATSKSLLSFNDEDEESA
ncbi:Immunoglobulin (CD79A) binding protein 1 [Cichlidogyrus casuarinus]|uniref:Immunoglobulin (CD79A) binding protein 1 n=1 Tax=Cichlidogyrus casuarinus TaxID=1844966 RepID=A0ABD2Q028_9PLAT